MEEKAQRIPLELQGSSCNKNKGIVLNLKNSLARLQIKLAIQVWCPPYRKDMSRLDRYSPLILTYIFCWKKNYKDSTYQIKSFLVKNSETAWSVEQSIQKFSTT